MKALGAEAISAAMKVRPLEAQPAQVDASVLRAAVPAYDTPQRVSPQKARSAPATPSPPRAAPPAPPKPLGPYKSGGPVWPAGSASSYPWKEAIGRLHRLPERRKGLQETIWARQRKEPCGKPCVAHCIAGQLRDILHNRGIWKGYKHRLFEKFSDAPVVFAVYSASGFGGGGRGDGFAAHVRTEVRGVDEKELLPGLEYMAVDRALILHEPCTTGSCMQKSVGLSCRARPLGLTAQYDRVTKNVTNFCDVQVRRLQTCMHLVREYETDHNVNFAWVARDRPDVYFAEPAARYTKLRPDRVYVKPWAACGYGGMDWWYVMPRRHADTMARFPDDMRCEYLQHPQVKPVCKDCIGCECFLAAWMYSQNVKFERVPPPWDGFIPTKFCGGGCPSDWNVNPESICRGFCQGREAMPDVKQR